MADRLSARVVVQVRHPTRSDHLAEWDVSDTDPAPGPLADLELSVLADGLTLVRKLPEGVPWPCQPVPAVLSFDVLSPDSSITSTVVLGATVYMRWWSPRDAADPVETFHGQVTDVTVEPVDGGVLIQVTAVEWVAVLGEVVIGDTVWPNEGSQARFDRIVARIHAVLPTLPDEWGYAPGPHNPGGLFNTPAGLRVPLVARDVDATPAWELLSHLLAAWVFPEDTINLVPGYSEPARYHLEAITDGLDLLGWWLVPHLAASIIDPPGRFALTSEGYGVTVPDDTDGSTLGQVPASQVDISARWAQRRSSAPNLVNVTVDNGGQPLVYRLSVEDVDPVVTYALETDLNYQAGTTALHYSGPDATAALAALLLPETGGAGLVWQAEEFTWNLAEAPAGSYLPDLGEVVTVAGVVAGLVPSPLGFPRDWVSGVLDSTTLRFADMRPTVAFTLRPQVRDAAASVERFTLADFPAGVTLDDLSPADTLADWRLLGTP